MSEKPKSLDAIWAERDLCEKLNLAITKSGRSRQLSNWIKGGLKYIEKSERRYFFENDVINYLWSMYSKGDETYHST